MRYSNPASPSPAGQTCYRRLTKEQSCPSRVSIASSGSLSQLLSEAPKPRQNLIITPRSSSGATKSCRTPILPHDHEAQLHRHRQRKHAILHLLHQSKPGNNSHSSSPSCHVWQRQKVPCMPVCSLPHVRRGRGPTCCSTQNLASRSVPP